VKFHLDWKSTVIWVRSMSFNYLGFRHTYSFSSSSYLLLFFLPIFISWTGLADLESNSSYRWTDKGSSDKIAERGRKVLDYYFFS